MPFDDAQADKTAIAATATIITAYFFIFVKFKITNGVKVKVFANRRTQNSLFFYQPMEDFSAIRTNDLNYSRIEIAQKRPLSISESGLLSA